MRTSTASFACSIILLQGCVSAPSDSTQPAPERAESTFELVQVERAFGDRAGDMPPGTCWNLSDTRQGRECIERRIVSLHVEDLDGDGLDEVTVRRVDGRQSTYQNLGGTFRLLNEETTSQGGGAGPSPVKVEADLNGDGWAESVEGRSADVRAADSSERYRVMLPPIIRDGEDGTRLHPFDFERRRMIGFSELVYVGDLTGDLVPDLLIAGQGMAYPHLYINSSPAARWAGVETEENITMLREGMPEMVVETERNEGPVTWSGRVVSVSVGEAGTVDVEYDDHLGQRSSDTLRAGQVLRVGP